MRHVKFIIECLECGEEIEIDFTPRVPARINCRMEDSCPEQPESFDPANCPKCGVEIDSAKVNELAEDKDQSDKDDYWDAKIQQQREQE